MSRAAPIAVDRDRSKCRGFLLLIVLLALPAHAENDLLPSITVDATNITVQLETIASGFPLPPTDLVPLPDGSGRLLFTTFTGDIRVLDASDNLLPTPFLSMANADTAIVGETTFTSLAFHPDFADPSAPGFRKFYTLEPEVSSAGVPDFLPDFGGDNHHDVLYEYTVDNIAASIFSGTRRELLRRQSPATSHNLNDLAFDSSGLLYISSGDGQANVLVSNNAQALTNIFGKLLRIDPLGLAGSLSTNGQYSVPADNPFVGAGGGVAEEIFAYGLRNPYRLSIDRETNDLWVADCGQDDIEEANRILAGSPGGENFAWNRREGSFPNSKTNGDVEPDDVLPVFEYDHQDGACVIGGFVYRGSEIPELSGKYVFADFLGNPDADPLPALGRLFYGDPATGEIFEFNIDASGPSLPARILGIGEDAAGELLLLATRSNFATGTVHRIKRPAGKLALHTTFDGADIVGGIAIDTAGLAENGAITGSVGNVAGQIGEALSFPGDDGSYVDFGDVLDPGSAGYTVSLWFNATDVDLPGLQFLAGKGNAGVGDDGWSIFLENGGTPGSTSLVVRGRQGDGVSSHQFGQGQAGGLSSAAWHHVALVIDRKNGLARGYLDGSNAGFVAGGSGATVDTLDPNLGISSSDPLLVGRAATAGAAFGGLVDDLAIWDRALTTVEIAGLHADGLAGRDASSLGLPTAGRIFFDDFNRGSDPDPGPGWSEVNLSFSVLAGRITQDSGATFAAGLLQYAEPTDSADQFGKIEISQVEGEGVAGLVFRGSASGPLGEHFQVHLVPGSGGSQWRLERWDGGTWLNDRKGFCDVPELLQSGDWIGATFTGSGIATTVDMWRWDRDPDGSAAVPDIPGNWGPPDCTISGFAGPYLDGRTGVGLRTYADDSPTAEFGDNWMAGDMAAAMGTPSACGDGRLDAGEECDDGRETSTCDGDCTAPSCGDGIFNPLAEACEADGDCPAAFACTACSCILTSCGDGVLDPGEECDDAGESATCDANCTVAACGDGTLNGTAGESCDDGGESATCDVDCTLAACGDGTVNGTAGETCDDGGETTTCDADCTAAACGDGTLNGTAGEICDDAGESATCDGDCTVSACGDGTLNVTAGEECEDAGGGLPSSTCDGDCTAALCGDGVFNPLAEACEQDADCPVAGDVCVVCACFAPGVGQLFSDDFNRANDDSPGADWVEENLAFSVQGNQLVQDSGAVFQAGLLRWTTATDTADQFGKIQVSSVQGSAVSALFFRGVVNGTLGEHYQAHLVPGSGTAQWRVERWNGGTWLNDRKGTCDGMEPLQAGNFIGVTVEGSGPSTRFELRRWDADPDAGGPVDIAGNWGPPDCTITGFAGPYLDIGTALGIRTYAGNSPNPEAADNWSAGDTVAAASSCGNGMPDPGEECDDAGESPTCDLDCTFAACGDGTLNLTAGETCDDAGESLICDTDCTPAACGDGTLNLTAGETCDDAGESASCDADCTGVACGDGILNVSAGEACELDTDCGVSEICAGCACFPAPVCGDGIVDPGEDCDDVGESLTCDADCTFAACGDGTLNVTAGETCDDGGESLTCDADCTAVACGDGMLNVTAGEECDDGGASATCDGDCTAALCGDGIFNPLAEACEVDGDCPVPGDVCTACACAPPPTGQVFSDDFNRPDADDPGSSWSEQNLAFSVAANRIVQDSGAIFAPGLLRWETPTDTSDQFGKIQVSTLQGSAVAGLFFRGNPAGPLAEHYQVHLVPGTGTAQWRVERWNGSTWLNDRKGTCNGMEVLQAGHVIGVTVEGSGAATLFRMWRWDTDPDGGGPVDIAGNWGPADCTVTGFAGPYLDGGTALGIRTYAGNSSAPEAGDDWTAGDIGAVTP